LRRVVAAKFALAQARRFTDILLCLSPACRRSTHANTNPSAVISAEKISFAPPRAAGCALARKSKLRPNNPSGFNGKLAAPAFVTLASSACVMTWINLNLTVF
jgi:hypothetical protein